MLKTAASFRNPGALPLPFWSTVACHCLGRGAGPLCRKRELAPAVHRAMQP